MTILGGTVSATGSAGGAGIGGGAGGASDVAADGGPGGAGGPAAGAGSAGVGGSGGVGGAGGAGAAGGAGGDGGSVTILRAAVTATGSGASADIGGGAGGTGGAGGSGGAGGTGGGGDAQGALGPNGVGGTTGPNGARGAGLVSIGPGAPTAASATAGHASATVSFVAPGSAGSSAITAYTVTATDVDDPARGGQQATGTTSPITVDGLTNSDAYTFTVTATNAVGTGLASAPTGAVTPERMTTTTDLVSSANPSTLGGSVTFTATVSAAPDAGAVTFEIDGATPIGCEARAIDPASGQATCQVADLPLGSHSVVASYGGDALFAGSVSATLTQAVVSPPLAPPPPMAAPFPPDPAIIAGLEAVGSATRTSRALSFTQRVVAAGTITWRLDVSFYLVKNPGRAATRRKPLTIATGTSTVAAAATVRQTIRLDARARAELKRYPSSRLVLRTTLRLTNGRSIQATKTLPRKL